MSRVSKPQDITIFLDDEEDKHGYRKGSPYTRNVVYRTVLENEIERYKESDDYQGPDIFDEGKLPTLIIFENIFLFKKSPQTIMVNI